SPCQFRDDRLEVPKAISHSGVNSRRSDQHVAAAKLGDYVVGLDAPAVGDRGDENIGKRINRALNTCAPFIRFKIGSFAGRLRRNEFKTPLLRVFLTCVLNNSANAD